jgi:hypothetical protein
VTQFFVVDDRAPNKWGIRSGLIYRGSTAFFSVRHQATPGKRRFLHLEHRLADLAASQDEILAAYLRKNTVPQGEQHYFCIARLTTKIGARYGRIIRPVSGFGSTFAYSRDEVELRDLLDLYAQLDAFLHRFSEIARVIHPCEANYFTCGYEIRSLLILACTEVEMLFKRLFWEDADNVRGSMMTFFRGAAAAKLSNYRVKLHFYRHLGAICPFSAWDNAIKYVPLDWYQSYNSTKHNRHSGFEKANLHSLIHALSACAILLKAQSPYASFINVKHSSLQSFEDKFSVEGPTWGREEHYWMVPSRSLKIMPVPGVE